MTQQKILIMYTLIIAIALILGLGSSVYLFLIAWLDFEFTFEINEDDLRFI